MSRNRFVALSVVVDAVVVNAGFVLAFLLRFSGQLPSFNFRAYLLLSPVLTLFYLGGAWAYGLYQPERSDTAWAVSRRVVAVVTVGTLMTAAVAFFGSTRTASFARSTILLAWALDVILLISWRLILMRVGRVNWPRQRVLIVGVGATSVELAREVARRDRWGWTLAGLIDPSTDLGHEPPAEAGGFPVLGVARDVARIAAEQRASRVIVVSPIALRELMESFVLTNEVRVRVDVVPELYEIFIGTVDAIVGDVPLVEITRATVPQYFAALKRVVDVIGALVLLVVTSPLLLVAGIAVAINDGLPVFFSQERLGKGMKPFRIHKLRTMVKDAEEASGPSLADEDDSRITRVGRSLRRFRIDELPQLVNVLAGDMSFVGPRPERPFFAEQYLAAVPGYRERFRVKPGVTGLAQVSGGYATTSERKLKYDLIYMYHQNLAMDIQIVVETLRVVLTGRGAR
jgi:exopolysaccharide biosynthesis polyprenyl glycosylphosphotransferase